MIPTNKVNIAFKSTKKKIAFTFAVLAGLLIASTTLVIILIVRYQMDLQALSLLSKGLTSVNSDFQANNLEEVSIAFQVDQTKTAEYESKDKLLNILDINKSVRSSSIKQAETSSGSDSESLKKEYFNTENEEKDSLPVLIADEESFERLKNNRQVYSRVILPNGDILYSSDLFDVLSVDPSELGFHKYSIQGICIYSQTEKIMVGEQEGAIIQVAQYCPFTTKQQQIITLTMVIITIFSSLFAYLIGILMAGYFLEPLQKSATQTRVFAQNVYHELFTPITVAITTVASSLRRKKYQKGLESVSEDLNKIQESLQLLSDKAFKKQAELATQKTNISLLLKEVFSEIEESNLIKNGKVNKAVADLSKVEKNIYKLVNKISIRLILKNIIDNAYKFSQTNLTEPSIIKVVLSDNSLVVSNQIISDDNIDINNIFNRYYRGNNSNGSDGKGLGLALVKELVELQGWKIKGKLEAGWFTVVIRFTK